jgi:hypothetical protein
MNTKEKAEIWKEYFVITKHRKTKGINQKRM